MDSQILYLHTVFVQSLAGASARGGRLSATRFFITQGVHMQRQDTHSKVIGYLLWIFGFLGAHRFYYGKPVTGTIWFLTLGLFFIGWIIDLFLIPAMDREADLRFTAGDTDYNVAWILLTFLGVFGVHRMYQGKWITGIIYLFTGGLFLLGVLYDFWTLNTQVSIKNASRA
jgi:TM2 domain-containing membrane protein YozV